MNAFTGATELLLATCVASLLGSMHCVAMCGPFAILATQRIETSRNRVAVNPLFVYHVGRLITYLVLGALAGSFSGLLQSTGILSSAGVAVGVLLVFVAIGRFGLLLFPNLEQGIASSSDSPWHREWILYWSRGLAGVRRWMPKNPRWLGPLGWGMTTTLLPCGWLYLFVLAAAAAPSLGMAVATMIAFWVGTLPLLSLSTVGWSWLGQRWRVLANPIAACCILGMGIYLIFARSPVDVASQLSNSPAISQIASQSSKQKQVLVREEGRSEHSIENENGWQRLERLRKLLNAGLPCCEPLDEVTRHHE